MGVSSKKKRIWINVLIHVVLILLLLICLLPIALVFSESSMSNLQSVSIVAAFPIGMVILLIVAGFLKDAGAYLKEIKKK